MKHFISRAFVLIALIVAIPAFPQGRERTHTKTYEAQKAQGLHQGAPITYSAEGAKNYFGIANFAHAKEYLPPDVQKAEGIRTSGEEPVPYPDRQANMERVRWNLFYSPSTRLHYKVGSAHGMFDNQHISGVVYVKRERDVGAKDYVTVKEWGVTSGDFYALDTGQNVRVAKSGGDDLCASKVGNAKVACEQRMKNDRIDKPASPQQPAAIAMRDCMTESGLAKQMLCAAQNAAAAGMTK